MWEYEVETGWLYSPAGRKLACGYSGRKGICRNNVAYERVAKCGPIPRGIWLMGRPVKSAAMGPLAIPLAWTTPGEIPGGRSAFFIHGDNVRGDASIGCIILPRDVRFVLAESDDSILLVRSAYQPGSLA